MSEPESEPRFERKDLDVVGVGFVGAMLVLCLILSTIATALWYHALSVRTQIQEGPVMEPMPSSESEFPKPQLQVDPPMDLAKLRQEEDAILGHYRWIDQKAGIVGIPIKDAMERLVRGGGQPVLGTPGLPQGPTWAEMMQRRAQEGSAERVQGNKP